MKNYSITVNGNVYDVAVEEVTAGTVSTPVTTAPISQKTAVTPKAAVAATAPVAAKSPAKNNAEGTSKILAPMPGKILDIKASVGDQVKRGTVILVLEAMKMENEIVASADGVIASINVSKNETVEAGDLLVSMN